jgi:multidrug resistance efflux pump
MSEAPLSFTISYPRTNIANKLLQSRGRQIHGRKENESKPWRIKVTTFIIFPILILIGAAVLYFYLQYERTHITTDDAFVDGRIHIIAPKVTGTVKVLCVNGNQL